MTKKTKQTKHKKFEREPAFYKSMDYGMHVISLLEMAYRAMNDAEREIVFNKNFDTVKPIKLIRESIREIQVKWMTGLSCVAGFDQQYEAFMTSLEKFRKQAADPEKYI